VAALTPTEPAATPEGDAVPAPDGSVPAAASAEENTTGDALETAHAIELEATLLAASSPGREARPEPAAAESTEPPVVAPEAEV
jgi:hypothetical protein